MLKLKRLFTLCQINISLFAFYALYGSVTIQTKWREQKPGFPH